MVQTIRREDYRAPAHLIDEVRLVKQKRYVIDRADVFVRVILQVAVRAASRSARTRTEVVTLLVGDVREIHRVAEFTAELRRAGPMNDAGENAHENNADHNADQADEGEIPFAVLFHFLEP